MGAVPAALALKSAIRWAFKAAATCPGVAPDSGNFGGPVVDTGGDTVPPVPSVAGAGGPAGLMFTPDSVFRLSALSPALLNGLRNTGLVLDACCAPSIAAVPPSALNEDLGSVN